MGSQTNLSFFFFFQPLQQLRKHHRQSKKDKRFLALTTTMKLTTAKLLFHSCICSLHAPSFILILQIFSHAQGLLLEIKAKVSSSGRPEDEIIRQNVLRSIATSLQDYSASFRSVQSSYVKGMF